MGGQQLSRRGLFAAAGAVGGATLLGPAALAHASPGSPVTPNSTTNPQATPPGLPTPISSPPVTGVSYQFREFNEVIPNDNWAIGRSWGGEGAYTTSGGGYLSTCFDLPPGATVYDIEWYTSNTLAASWGLHVWVAGQGSAGTPVTGGTIAAGSGTITATRTVAPSTSNGPFPHGTRLLAFLDMSGTTAIQLNGVRVGFKSAPTAPVLLPSPVRVYDSRTHDGPLAAGHTRTISLGSHLPRGAVGAIVNLTVTRTVDYGYLTLYPAGVPRPGTSSINWVASGQTIANQATTAVGAGNKVIVYAGGHATQFVIDLLAYLA